MRSVAASGPRQRGRWVWSLSGVVTLGLLAIPGVRLIAGAGEPAGGPPPASAVPTRTVTITQPVTSLRVESYGAQIRVTAAPVPYVQVTEAIKFTPPDAGAPAVTQTVSRGRLTLTAPACEVSDCSVGFTVTVPADVTVTAASDGGLVTLSGIAGASVDSAGGPVSATRIRGPLTVHTEGGALSLDGVTGPLYADTGGGPLLAQGVAAAVTSVSTEGGEAAIQFTAAPRAVTVSTDGGPAVLAVPGGPYALTADSGGGPQLIGVPADPTAPRSIAVTSDGGPLQIEPAAVGASFKLLQPLPPQGKPVVAPPGTKPTAASPQQASAGP